MSILRVINEYTEQLRLAAENYGLRPSQARICPRVVAGKRCLTYHRSRCLCDKHRSLLDHGRMWLDEHGRHVLTGEPYHIAPDDLAAFTDDMAKLGLQVNVKPKSESFWYPGHTHLILITSVNPPRRRKPDPAGVTWKTIEDTITDRWNGRLSYQSGSRRNYAIPSPTGGHLTLEITLRPRWCSLTVDRWATTDRCQEPSDSWLKEHVWPVVKEAVRQRAGGGFLPSGGGTCAGAHPIERPHLLDLIVAWVDAELTWGQPRNVRPASASRPQEGAR